ncbi:MAG: 50S ribosomal protein L4 [Candidatus Acidiferrales bacterium]
MPVVDVKNLEGETIGQITLADDVFAAEVNPHLLHEAVRHFLAGERAGTHKTKDKSEVSGSGKKLWKQKGTGRARIGSIRSPLWRHGGTVHGPVPRSYAYALPKKMILGALRSALTTKLSQQKLIVVDGWQLESHKTKAFRAALTKLDGEAKSILLVDAGENSNLERASRNLEGVTLVQPARLGPYDLLRHDRLMLSREAATRLSGALSANKSEDGVAQASTGPESSAETKPAKAAAAKPPKRAAKAAPKAGRTPAKKPAVKKAAKHKAKKD